MIANFTDRTITMTAEYFSSSTRTASMVAAEGAGEAFFWTHSEWLVEASKSAHDNDYLQIGGRGEKNPITVWHHASSTVKPKTELVRLNEKLGLTESYGVIFGTVRAPNNPPPTDPQTTVPRGGDEVTKG